MAGGWSRDGAVQDQIDASVDDAVRAARAAACPPARARLECEECDAPIPEARRKAVPGVQLCVRVPRGARCRGGEVASGFNRRGSKDSQLR